MKVPVAVQALAGLFAVLAFVFHVVHGFELVLQSAAIEGAGYLLVGLSFTALFTWVAAAPGHAGETLARIFSLDLSDGAHVLAAVIQIAFLYLVFGGTLIATGHGLQTYVETGKNPAGSGELSAEVIVAGLLVNLVLFVLAAASWLFLVHGHRGRAILRELGLQLERFPRGVLWGLGATLVVFVVLAAIAVALQQLGFQDANPQADAIASALTPQLAILVALMAGFGEEIYFRGFLQPKLGNFWQATFFGLIHATYLTPLQVVLPFLLGLFLGVLRDRVGLWAPITTHATYNATALLVAIEFGDELGNAIAWLFG